GAPAVDVTLVSSSVLTARTPPGDAGPADLLVASEHGVGARAGAYLYFDPATRFGGTSGGRIADAGAVNVTVLNSYTGRGIPGAFATLSLATHGYSGLTDRNGQIVFSGPELAGPQTVTAAKEDFTSATIAAFDAENVTL